MKHPGPTTRLGNLHGGPGKIGSANNGPHARAGLWHSYSYIQPGVLLLSVLIYFLHLCTSFLK